MDDIFHMKLGCNKFIDYLLISVIILYPFLFIWQGGDLTDTGFQAIHCHFFRENIESHQFSAATFLTYFIGYIWLKLFPIKSIIALHILFALMFQSVIYICWKILSGFATRRIVLLGIFAGQTFALRSLTLVYGYDIAACFFSFLMLYFFWLCIERRNRKFIFHTGICAGLMSLARLPNVLIVFALPLLLFFHIYSTGEHYDIKHIIYNILIFLLGFCVLFLIFGAIIWYYGLTNAYIKSLFQIGAVATGHEYRTGYALSDMLISYYQQIIKFIPYLTVSILGSFCLSFTSRKANKYFYYVTLAIIISVSFWYCYYPFSYRNPIVFLVPAMILLPSIESFISKNKEIHRYKILVLMAWVITFLGIIGSNTGFFLKMSYGFIFLIPLTVISAWQQRISFSRGIEISWRPIIIAILAITISISFIVRVGGIYHVKERLSVRFLARYKVNHSRMIGIYTTKERSCYIESVMKVLEQNLTPDDTLYVYGSEVLFYYLANQYPVLPKNWLNNKKYTAEEIFTDLGELIKKRKRAPTILVTREDILGNDSVSTLNNFFDKHSYYSLNNGDRFTLWKAE